MKMEFTTFSLYVFPLIFFLIMLHKLSKRNSKTINLPPGPTPLPIIGNLHQISTSGTGLIHHVLKDLAKKYGPLMHLKFGEVPTIVITSPEMAKEIYKSHDVIFSQRPTNLITFKIVSYNFTDIIFSPYGNYWKTLRKICILELLNPKRVHSLRSVREEEVLNVLRKIYDNRMNKKEENRVINLSQMIFSMTYGITSRAAFGERNKSQDYFEELVTEINKMAAAGGSNISDLYPALKFLEMFSGSKCKLEKLQSQIDEILQDILDEHREKRKKSISDDHDFYDGRDDDDDDEKEDIVDVLLRIQENGEFEVPLADNNLKAVLFDIFSAGSETSSTTLEWAISETLKNPRILKRAQEEVRSKFDKLGNVVESTTNNNQFSELKYLEAIVKETLRLHPSAPLLLPRESSEDCVINGYDIPANTRVIINAWAIGRDPNFWNEAEVFNPERFLDSEVDYKGNHFQYLPFGGGRRICPGISFAFANIMLPFAQFLFHFDWKLSGDDDDHRKFEELDMEESMGVSVRRKNDLKLIPIPYPRSVLMAAA